MQGLVEHDAARAAAQPVDDRDAPTPHCRVPPSRDLTMTSGSDSTQILRLRLRSSPSSIPSSLATSGCRRSPCMSWIGACRVGAMIEAVAGPDGLVDLLGVGLRRHQVQRPVHGRQSAAAPPRRASRPFACSARPSISAGSAEWSRPSATCGWSLRSWRPAAARRSPGRLPAVTLLSES